MRYLRAHVGAVSVDEPLLDASRATWGAFTDLAAAPALAGSHEVATSLEVRRQ